MPARADNINAFDLKLLKALLNFKLNKHYTSDLPTWQKRDLCKSFNEKEGVIEIHHDHLLRIWPKENEISHKITLDTLDQLCSVLKTGYRWYLFTNDISSLRPKEIPADKPYADLSNYQKTLINRTVEEVFSTYKSFEDFEKVVIDKIATSSTIPQNGDGKEQKQQQNNQSQNDKPMEPENQRNLNGKKKEERAEQQKSKEGKKNKWTRYEIFIPLVTAGLGFFLGYNSFEMLNTTNTTTDTTTNTTTNTTNDTYNNSHQTGNVINQPKGNITITAPPLNGYNAFYSNNDTLMYVKK